MIVAITCDKLHPESLGDSAVHDQPLQKLVKNIFYCISNQKVSSTLQTGASGIALLDLKFLQLSSSQYASTHNDEIQG